ncbi:hypothetical protein MGYG_08855 [Nannizzia gypsea CBS 118893]|uniref:BTB domain-containing protein n=1 Tax=Arthroderma gypseum (strain ATCC MYA-4604 / CBS 118893) TaxID=535722 RepID=E4V764_ARTGP|nr:hypothetical protein MGYG_08855 [Nannizzia gypsea CBS 118893]EFQ96930.1 hypothetical protein MGYG_08855 [Nannizzia gypsea CBS 118893]
MAKKKKEKKPCCHLAGAQDTSTGTAYDNMGKAKEDALRASLKRYFDASKFTDLVIRTADKDIKVHKVVVCGQSEYFSRIFDGDWKEATENVVNFSNDDDPVTVEAMVRFMYEADYDASGSNNMLFHARVYKVAEKYIIPDLKEKALEKFEAAVRTCWGTDDFPSAIEEVYTSIPAIDRVLRDVISQTAFENIESLLRKDGFQSVSVVRAAWALCSSRPAPRWWTTDEKICQSCGDDNEFSLPR